MMNRFVAMTAMLLPAVLLAQDTARVTPIRVLQDSTGRSRIVSREPADPFAQHLYPPELIMQNQARLKLTESQRNFIVGEITKLQATAVQVQWRVGDESEKLAELLRQETVPEADALAQVDKVIGFETAVKRAQLSMLIRIRNILTAEQRTMLRELQRRE